MHALRFGLAGALFLAGVGASCGGGQRPPADGGQDHPTDVNSGELTACLDRPENLDRPPSGRLPCELIPPGLRLQD